MEFRQAVEKDINDIMCIIRQAQNYFKKHGIDQWQNNYPTIETIQKDIQNKNGYVLVEDNKIIGTVALFLTGDKNYDVIYSGKWITNETYATIHRIAIDSNYKGQGRSNFILKQMEKKCLQNGIHSIKVDTHRENEAMKKWLLKNGFQYCGVIYLEDQSERIAFEKQIKLK